MNRSLASLKARARAQASVQRASLDRDFVHSAALKLAEKGLPFVHPPGIIAGFYPHKTEISVLDFLQRLRRETWQICLPAVISEHQALQFRLWEEPVPLIKGFGNIPTPPKTARSLQPDIVLVPVLAYDSRGFRLGYGGGFYDRTLAQLRSEKEIIAIGVAFSIQEIEHIPHNIHDQKLDWIMTERTSFPCD